MVSFWRSFKILRINIHRRPQSFTPTDYVYTFFFMWTLFAITMKTAPRMETDCQHHTLKIKHLTGFVCLTRGMEHPMAGVWTSAIFEQGEHFKCSSPNKSRAFLFWILRQLTYILLNVYTVIKTLGCTLPLGNLLQGTSHLFQFWWESGWNII